MFNKLRRSIYIPIMAIALALILFIDIFAIIMLTDTLKDAYGSMDSRRVSRTLDSCELYISSAAMSTYNLSLDDSVTAKLNDPSQRDISSTLDSVCTYALKINAVSAYSPDGRMYTSTNATRFPTLSELKQNAGIAEFIAGDADSAVSFRTEKIAGVYGNVVYPEEMGVITCCQKVYDGEQVIGYLFADILPSNIYDLIFENGQFADAIAFIMFDGKYFRFGENTENEHLLSDNHKGYFKYSASSGKGVYSITVFNGTGEYSSQLAILISALGVASIALAVGVHFAAKFTADSVTSRLDALSEKMRGN